MKEIELKGRAAGLQGASGRVRRGGVHLTQRLSEVSRVKMDADNPVVELCVAGSRAELEGRPEQARALYQRAWKEATNDYEACIAAHYLARFQEGGREALRWNEVALMRAEAAKAGDDGRVTSFFPSLYLGLGKAHENLGNEARARHFYSLAQALGATHRMP